MEIEHRFGFGDSCIAVTEHLCRTLSFAAQPLDLYFIHGRLGSRLDWDPVIHALQTRTRWPLRCFAMDLPGFGESFSAFKGGFSLLESVDLVQKLMERLQSREAWLVGHDYGGAIAQVVTLEDRAARSGVVQGLTLIETLNLSSAYSKIPESNMALQILEKSWPRHYQRKFWRTLIKEYAGDWQYMDSEASPGALLKEPEWVADAILGRIESDPWKKMNSSLAQKP